jgi:deoxyribose-phosphate aldolase
MSRAVPSKQIDAAFKMGGIEGRVSVKDSSIKATEFRIYLRNAEIAEMMADNKVLKAIIDSGYLAKDSKLKNRYEAYKSKYWKK